MQHVVPLMALCAILGALGCGDQPVQPAQTPSTDPHGLLVTRYVAGKPKVFALRPDGSDPVQLTTGSSMEYCPRWSPDGTRILYSSEFDSTDSAGRRIVLSQLFVMNADGSKPLQLTHGVDPSGCGSWSPDGRRIAFDQYDPQLYGYQVYTMRADGSDQVRITANAWESADPHWSPDGRSLLIAVVGKETSWHRRYLIDPDGANLRPVNNALCPANVCNIAWSPDGAHLAFDCDGSFGTEVYVSRVDGSERRLLSPPTGPEYYGHDQLPIWSPDGTAVAISRSSGARWGLYRIALDSGQATLLLSDSDPIWPGDWRRTE